MIQKHPQSVTVICQTSLFLVSFKDMWLNLLKKAVNGRHSTGKSESFTLETVWNPNTFSTQVIKYQCLVTAPCVSSRYSKYRLLCSRHKNSMVRFRKMPKILANYNTQKTLKRADTGREKQKKKRQGGQINVSAVRDVGMFVCLRKENWRGKQGAHIKAMNKYLIRWKIT